MASPHVRLNIHTDPLGDLAGLHQAMVNTLEQIDCALDRGDRRAFRAWSSEYRDLTTRCGSLLAAIATAKD